MYRDKETNVFVSADLVEKGTEDQYSQIHTDVNLVKAEVMDVEGYKSWTRDHTAKFRLNDQGEFRTFSQVEKMSKSYYNTIDPQVLSEEVGADTMRLYEMFSWPYRGCQTLEY